MKSDRWFSKMFGYRLGEAHLASGSNRLSSVHIIAYALIERSRSLGQDEFDLRGAIFLRQRLNNRVVIG